MVTPDRADRYDENALDRRHLAVATDQTGMVLVSGQLDPVTGSEVPRRCWTTSSRATVPPAAADGAEMDVRTRGQRRVDALGLVADAAAEFLGLGTATTGPTADPTTAQEPEPVTTEHAPLVRQRAARAVPRVVVVTTPEQLAGTEGAGAAVTTDGDLVDRGALTRIACDAVIDRVVLDKAGRVLAMDTIGRLATAAQQTALAARDRGCVWPGCTTPPSLCEAHHVIWWSRGGPTTIDNLALLCHRHHTQVHAQPDDADRPGDGWVMVMRDGIPWFRPPDRLDPDRRLRRNTFHQTVDATRAPACAGARPSTETDPTRPTVRRGRRRSTSHPDRNTSRRSAPHTGTGTGHRLDEDHDDGPGRTRRSEVDRGRVTWAPSPAR